MPIMKVTNSLDSKLCLFVLEILVEYFRSRDNFTYAIETFQEQNILHTITSKQYCAVLHNILLVSTALE